MNVLIIILLLNTSIIISTTPNSTISPQICSQDECIINPRWNKKETCEYIRCNKAACEGGGYLKWTSLVQCEFRNGVRIFLIIVAIIYLLCLFIVMTYIADDFFSPSIAGIVKNLNISESIAGVTFLAFGNGAPDIFGSVASVIASSKPKADLAIGDILGGGLFVTTVVLSAIILTKSFRIAILPTIRDIIFLIIADVLIAVYMLYWDEVELWMPATFLVLYAIYVIIVILMRSFSNKVKKHQSLLTNPNNKNTEDNPNSNVSQHVHSLSELIEIFITFAPILTFFNKKNSHIYSTNNETLLAVDKIWCDIDNEGEEKNFVISHGIVCGPQFADQQQKVNDRRKSKQLLKSVWRSVNPFPKWKEFKDMNFASKCIRIIGIIPLFFLKLTVPLNEQTWCKPVSIIQCFLSTQFLLFAIQLSAKSPINGSPGLWLYAFGISFILSLIVLIFTSIDTPPKYYKQTCSYIGFLMSIAWIYTTSSEIINVITMIGVETGVSQELLGLTILAWSNCIGDVVADVAVVKQGYPKMAMAAAIGGPLFNLLIGFGLPFTIAALQGKSIDLDITPVYKLLFLFLGISSLASLIGIFVQKFKVNWPHAVALIIIFLLFILFLILSATNVLVWN